MMVWVMSYKFLLANKSRRGSSRDDSLKEDPVFLEDL